MSQDVKQFSCNAFFRSDNEKSSCWGFFRIRFGQGLGFSFELIGSLFARSHGMAVLDINSNIIEVVRTFDFTAAAEALGTPEFKVINCTEEAFQDWLLEKTPFYWDQFDSLDATIERFYSEKNTNRTHPVKADTRELQYRFPHYGEDIIIPKGTTLLLPTDHRSDSALWDAIIGNGKFYQKLKVSAWLKKREYFPNAPEPKRADVINGSFIQCMGPALKEEFGLKQLPWKLEHDLALRVSKVNYTKGNQSANIIDFKIRDYGGLKQYRSRNLVVETYFFESVKFHTA